MPSLLKRSPLLIQSWKSFVIQRQNKKVQHQIRRIMRVRLIKVIKRNQKQNIHRYLIQDQHAHGQAFLKDPLYNLHLTPKEKLSSRRRHHWIIMLKGNQSKLKK